MGKQRHTDVPIVTDLAESRILLPSEGEASMFMQKLRKAENWRLQEPLNSRE